MNHYTITNRAGRPARYFAKTEARAFELALQFGQARSKENLRLLRSRAVDEAMFPHEGLASLRLSPAPRVYVAAQKIGTEYVSFDQNSDDLDESTTSVFKGGR